MNKRLQSSVLDMVGGLVASIPPIIAVQFGYLGPIKESLPMIAIGSSFLVIVLARTFSLMFGRGFKSPFEHVLNLHPISQSTKHLVFRDLLLSVFALGTAFGEWSLTITFVILMVPVHSRDGFQNLADRLFGITYTES